MKLLIVKLGATGDVVRTTPILARFNAEVTWITAAKNVVFVENVRTGLRSLPWERREEARDLNYDLVINLEDDLESAQFVNSVRHRQLFGAYLGKDNQLQYTDDSRRWFDLSLISCHGRQEADRLKLLNRDTYQELIFAGLGFTFSGERYLLPPHVETDLSGDVAISPEAGPVWPMKNWAYFGELKRELESRGWSVNNLPRRSSLLEHLGDVRNHRLLISGDSLPMHLALGSGVKCVSLFTCTSPWEIHGYGLQKQLVSPLLGEFFYKRNFDARATTAISLEQVIEASVQQLQSSKAALALD